MTLRVLKEVIGDVKSNYIFFKGSGVEIIGINTCGRYQKNSKNRMTIDGIPIKATENEILDLSIYNITAHQDTLVVYIED